MQVKIFADGADKSDMLTMYRHDWIKGFTTNPTLMRKAGILNYSEFIRDIVSCIPDRSISFGILSDDFSEMRKQALKIARFGKNVYVKIPITNTKGESSAELIRELANEGVKQNVTALLTVEQVEIAALALSRGPSATISVFAGRIADTGRDPIPIMQSAVKILSSYGQLELIWASPRELLNVFQANEVGCHIITVTNDILKKLSLIGKDLCVYSLETVQMFYDDALKAGYSIEEKLLT